jgi:hypothetical protein
MSDYKAALTEATIDTMIALPLNFFINWIVLTVAFGLDWGATVTTLVATSIFTAVAIFRKTYVRLHFQKRDK